MFNRRNRERGYLSRRLKKRNLGISEKGLLRDTDSICKHGP